MHPGGGGARIANEDEEARPICLWQTPLPLERRYDAGLDVHTIRRADGFTTPVKRRACGLQTILILLNFVELEKLMEVTQGL